MLYRQLAISLYVGWLFGEAFRFPDLDKPTEHSSGYKHAGIYPRIPGRPLSHTRRAESGDQAHVSNTIVSHSFLLVEAFPLSKFPTFEPFRPDGLLL